jgi:uncharacterized protein (DUF1697 family)
VLFRGINVGGNKIAKMETLRTALSEAGFGNIATYIQSGNVVLTSGVNAEEVAASVEKVFAATFGFSSRPTVRSLAEWRQIIAGNPYPEAATDHKKLHAVILDGEPPKDAIETLHARATTERVELKNGVLYLHTPDGFGVSAVAEALDRVLKAPLTARNWKTVLTLRDMAENIT